MTYCTMGITEITYDAINEIQNAQIISSKILETEKGTFQAYVGRAL